MEDPVSCHLTSDGLCHRPSLFPFQIFPHCVIEAARRYRFDEKVQNDPVEHQRIYEELKIEAALLVNVRIPVPPSL